MGLKITVVGKSQSAKTIVLAPVFAVLVGGAYGQGDEPSSQKDVRQLEEVLVTANKRDVLGETAISLAALPQTVEFPVTQTDRLVQIDLGAHPSNAWLWVGMEVLDPEGETLFESGRAMEFYSGRDSDGTWTEGNRTANLRFRPPAAGTYQIIFNEKETELWISGSEPTSFTVSAREGVRSAGWLGVLGILFGLVAVIPLGRRLWHRTVRFSGSDWTDED